MLLVVHLMFDNNIVLVLAVHQVFYNCGRRFLLEQFVVWFNELCLRQMSAGL